MTMAKKESTLFNMILTLLVITVVAGISLGYINDLTKGPKEAARLAKKTRSLEAVLPDFSNDPIDEMELITAGATTDSLEFYPAYGNDIPVGAAVIGWSNRGYNGLVKVMVGFNPDGSINNAVVLEQKETPGLGTKIKDDPFISQLRGKDPANFKLMVKKDKGDVDALTGATISSRAFLEATQKAYEAYMNSQKKE